jgi:hypothetical protein
MEIKELRSEVTGRRPDEMPRARAMLDAEMADPARPSAHAGHAGRTGHAGRLRRHPVIAASTAVAAAAALAAGVVSLQPAPRQATSGQTTTATLTARYVLDRAAAAAPERQPVPGPDQLIEVSVADTAPNLPQSSSLVSFRTQEWVSVDGHREGLIHNIYAPGSGKKNWMAVMATCGTGLVQTTYEWLKTLPTDPAALRSWIYAHPNGGNPPDQQAWNDVSDMLGSPLLPPKLAAALFRVAATIPGTTIVKGVRDAAGRPGVAVGRGADQLILDPQTYQLLGSRAVLKERIRGGPAKTVVSSTSILSVKIVSSLPPVKLPGAPFKCAQPGVQLSTVPLSAS